MECHPCYYSHHENILGNDLGPEALVQLLSPPPVPERDRDGSLGTILADYVVV